MLQVQNDIHGIIKICSFIRPLIDQYKMKSSTEFLIFNKPCVLFEWLWHDEWPFQQLLINMNRIHLIIEIQNGNCNILDLFVSQSIAIERKNVATFWLDFFSILLKPLTSFSLAFHDGSPSVSLKLFSRSKNHFLFTEGKIIARATREGKK